MAPTATTQQAMLTSQSEMKPGVENRHAATAKEIVNGDSGLQMAPEHVRALVSTVTDLLVERTETLAAGDSWDGEFRSALAARQSAYPPENGRPATEVVEQVGREILPLSARLDHPRFFGFIPSSPTWPGLLAEFMSAACSINQCTWLTASGASQIELTVIDWIRQWIGYPEGAGGLFTSGASAASVNALVAARQEAGHPERPSIYMSDQSHTTLARAAMIVGVRPENARWVPSDGHFRLDMERLRHVVANDRAQGLTPIAVCANAGTASTGAIDPLIAVAKYCEDEGVWLHIDAAYGGFAVVTDEGERQANWCQYRECKSPVAND